MPKIITEAFRYAASGVVNTVVGFGCIFFFMLIGFADILANMVGYIVGFIVSYILNGRWTFEGKNLGRSALRRYALVIVVAYLCNICALLFIRDFVGLNSVYAQLGGACIYSAIGFIGAKYFAFTVRTA